MQAVRDGFQRTQARLLGEAGRLSDDQLAYLAAEQLGREGDFMPIHEEPDDG